ncbi:MAG: hypothetical protein NZM44_07695, partial [Candidatus Calescibacterium sp.]|nr:hypothetical protein [Candidatus Calescibacterium sp.]
VIKIDNEGNLDKTFAKQGKLIQNILKNNGDIGRSIYISKNDNIYLIGSTLNGYNFDTYVIKMNNKGEIDNNFGENGKAIIDNPGKINDPYIDDFGNCIYVDRKEKIYISGETGKNNNYDIYIIRLNRKGKVDTSFGNQGKVIIKDVGNKNGDDRCESMTVNNNSIFLLGNNFNITNYDTFLIKIK